MRKHLKLAAATAVLAVMWQTGAQAVVIDFNGLVGTSLVDRGVTYQEDGFQLDNLSSPFTSIHSRNSRFTGTVSFLNNAANGVTRLTQIGGGTFDLISIDLDSLNSAANTPVTFTGTLADASTVTQLFTTDLSFPALQTFVFNSTFVNLLNVTWVQVVPGHSFDNIVVNATAVVDPPVSAVPEAMTLGLLGAGLAGIGALRRRGG